MLRGSSVMRPVRRSMTSNLDHWLTSIGQSGSDNPVSEPSAICYLPQHWSEHWEHCAFCFEKCSKVREQHSLLAIESRCLNHSYIDDGMWDRTPAKKRVCRCCPGFRRCGGTPERWCLSYREPDGRTIRRALRISPRSARVREPQSQLLRLRRKPSSIWGPWLIQLSSPEWQKIGNRIWYTRHHVWPKTLPGWSEVDPRNGRCHPGAGLCPEHT